jgi:hypothetical protein
MPVLEVPASEFSDDEWMTSDISFIQQGFQSDGSIPQMGHPHRSINQDHS